MTEKRFKINADYLINIDNIIDNKTGIEHDYLEIEELLNGLNDENEQLNENNMHLHYELRLKNDKVLGLEKENKELSEQVEYLKKQVKIFRGECNRLTKENTELLEELYD